MGKPSYLCRVLFARALVLGLRFFVSMNTERGAAQPARTSQSRRRRSQVPLSRQITVKRKLVDFVTFWRFLLVFRPVLPSFRVDSAKVLINSIFRKACFDQSSGSPRGNPRKGEGARVDKLKNRRVFCSK